MKETEIPRSLGLVAATGVGVGAIVGGGVLALAGVAFAATGPSAIVAFGINGIIAALTALSFAELAAAFPISGGAYAFAKRVLNVEAAFVVGWVVWFASIVAAVLYALGFAAYGATALTEIGRLAGAEDLSSLNGRLSLVALALAAVVFYSTSLLRRAGGGGQWATVGKLVVFAILIAGGAWALGRTAPSQTLAHLRPFYGGGGAGLLAAMGYTFIALQGFDLIAAVGGEVRDPGRNIPRAMLLSLGAALAVYIPFLFLIATVGVPAGQTVSELAASDPTVLVPVAARNYLGTFGFWLVIVAGVLSMLSALQANLFAASRVAFAMARDRTLPAMLGRVGAATGTPGRAIVGTAAIVSVTVVLIPDVAAAGAASSLIFLVSFALVHWTNVLMRRRGGVSEPSFRVPLFPLVPAIGGFACAGLAAFQARAVPSAGAVAVAWLGLGWVLYLVLFARRARVADASAEALDLDLARLRGREPFVLVPIANPATAAAMVELASYLAPRSVGRVLLLSVVRPPERWSPGQVPRQLVDAQDVLGQALTASFASSLAPEALTVVAPEPWSEIQRVCRDYRCESLLLGIGSLDSEAGNHELERLMSEADAHVVVLRAPAGWQPAVVRRVLVPVRGRGDQSRLRARLLGSLGRGRDLEVVFLGIVPTPTPEPASERLREEIATMAADEAPGRFSARIERSDDVAAAVAQQAADCDLVIVGVRRFGRRHKTFGEVAPRVARATDRALVLISRRR